MNPDDYVDEDTTNTTEELLDWLCWSVATTGERFFPPDETAEACIESLAESDVAEVDDHTKGWEKGQHARAWGEAVVFYEDLTARGYDPVGRAQRSIIESREDGLALERIDWSWLPDNRELDGGPDERIPTVEESDRVDRDDGGEQDGAE